VPRRPSSLRAIHTTLACALGLLMVGAAPAFAQDTFRRDETPLSPEATGSGDSTATDVGSSGGAIVRMLIGLAIVIAVIYAIYALLKRANGRKGGVRSDGRMTVVASTQLAPGAAVHLVQVGDELVLVGQAQQGVTPIRIYTADEAQRLGVALDRGVSPFVPTGRPAASGKPGAGGFKKNFGASLVEELRRRTTRG
jgi:flagellar protein FliO/FliZ